MKSRFVRPFRLSLVGISVITGLVGQQSSLCGQQANGANVSPANTNKGTTLPGQPETRSKQERTLDDVRKGMKSGMGMGMGVGMGGYGGEMGGMDMGMGSGGPQSEKQLLAQLIQKLRQRLNSKKQDRQTVEKQLRSALQQYFDTDMEERVREFDKVKARLEEMEAKLQRRLSSDREIIELQLKQMLHKADGLDFSIPSGYEGGYGSMGGSPGMGGMSEGGMGMEDMGGGMGMGMGGGMGMAPRGNGMGSGGGYGGEGSSGMGAASGGYSGGRGYGGGGYSEQASGLAAYGDEGGLGSFNNNASPQTMGYDIWFGFTRFQRLDAEDLDDQDPLVSYKKTNEVQANANSTQSNAEKLKHILSAFHLFESRFHHLPRSANQIARNQPPHSWRVAILPLIGQTELYNQYKFDQPWDSPENLRLSKKMPEIYRSTDHRSQDSTLFQMLFSEGAFDSSIDPPRFADITDGSSNTIALIESSKETVWTKPEDVVPLNGFIPLNESRLVGFADGHIQSLPQNLEPQQIRALVTRAGGEVITLPQP
jgi:hypothetical protein